MKKTLTMAALGLLAGVMALPEPAEAFRGGGFGGFRGGGFWNLGVQQLALAFEGFGLGDFSADQALGDLVHFGGEVHLVPMVRVIEYLTPVSTRIAPAPALPGGGGRFLGGSLHRCRCAAVSHLQGTELRSTRTGWSHRLPPPAAVQSCYCTGHHPSVGRLRRCCPG